MSGSGLGVPASAGMANSLQLPLAIGLNDSACFENFLPGTNQEACHTLEQGRESFVYLWGGAGSGKSHLLQAACHAEDSRGGRAVYLPLQELLTHPPQLLDGMELLTLVCLDDLNQLAGQNAWQQAIFHLYNRLREQGHRLLAAGSTAPAALGLTLADLTSRLGWGPVYHLVELDDIQKAEALRLHARQRGMEMSGDVASYLLNHGPRDMHRLFALLERIDELSLVEQRRLTIPFVRRLL